MKKLLLTPLLLCFATYISFAQQHKKVAHKKGVVSCHSRFDDMRGLESSASIQTHLPATYQISHSRQLIASGQTNQLQQYHWGVQTPVLVLNPPSVQKYSAESWDAQNTHVNESTIIRPVPVRQRADNTTPPDIYDLPDRKDVIHTHIDKALIDNR